MKPDRRRIMRIWASVVCPLLGLCALGAAGQESAPAPVFKYGMDHAMQSRYVWRGFLLDEGPVLQQGTRVAAYGFTAGVWGSFGIGAGEARDSDEVDYTVDFTRAFGKASVSVGNTLYRFPSADLYSAEFYLAVSRENFLHPRLTWFHDYGREEKGGGDGDYLECTTEVRAPLRKSPVTLGFRARAGYNRKLFLAGEGIDVGFGTGCTWALTKSVSLVPGVNVSMPFGDLKDAAGQEGEFIVGFQLSFGS